MSSGVTEYMKTIKGPQLETFYKAEGDLPKTIVRRTRTIVDWRHRKSTEPRNYESSAKPYTNPERDKQRLKNKKGAKLRKELRDAK